ncbi:PREDICTED: protein STRICTOSIDINE SYNTHASE-LIKE 10-like [Nelumbo nucifera]|uniref:Strictosidine synthase conserved region domain-containing protein n=2 Tax=Nelumbo nucifera TaxID=4432 RepID=A0A822YQX2_NELNU|nr:PREDICTED: protein STRICTOSIDINE SYNTHASE-LIKE 10-like [Nelumbo nucifera]DAD31608.1 TPA_asm: hypothetical protein HUJ06_010459 [Nelumbo nucifera]
MWLPVLSISFFLSLSFAFLSYQVDAFSQLTRQYNRLPIPSAVGPESFAFDCNGEGPYTGVSGGRILKWQGAARGWAEFASTSPPRDICFNGANDPETELVCGRPLGLQFNKATCELYIADSSFGLMVVGRDGGVAKLLANSAEGVPFRFTNALDFDQDNGIVYFTDSSIWIPRWEFLIEALSGDETGRLMKYDPKTEKLTVLWRGLSFPNGAALSKDNSFILIAETSKARILRYWLRGPKAQTLEFFLQLPGFPDNVKSNGRGEFWVALNPGKPSMGATFQPRFDGEIVALRFDEEGNILEVLNSRTGTSTLTLVSEVEENNGNLWIGSVVLPYVSLSKV